MDELTQLMKAVMPSHFGDDEPEPATAKKGKGGKGKKSVASEEEEEKPAPPLGAVREERRDTLPAPRLELLPKRQRQRPRWSRKSRNLFCSVRYRRDKQMKHK